MAARRASTTRGKTATTTTSRRISQRRGASAQVKVEKQPQTFSSQKSLTQRLDRRFLLLILIILAIAAVLFANRGLFIAATVNGQPISRFEVIKDLERQGGKQTLDSLVTKRLIRQEAKKRNITIDQKDTDNEIKKIDDNLSKQGQKLDQALQTQGMTRADLEDQIRTRLLIEKILADKVSVSDKEVSDYMTTNKDLYPQPTDSQGQSTPSYTKDQLDQAKQAVAQQKLSTEFQKWIKQVQQSAKINYFVKY